MNRRLSLSRSLRDALVDQATEGYPQEICGFVLGKGQKAVAILPLPNQSPQAQHAFTVPPQALLSAFKQAEAQELDLLAVYHSHPHSPPLPSAHDTAHTHQHYPHLPQLIIGLRPSLRLSAWLVSGSQPVQVEIIITDEGPGPQGLHAAQVLAILLALLISLLIFFSASLTLLPPAPPLPTPIG